MTIDERIERLTERHEALAQSVEMVTHDIATLTQRVETTSRDVAALTERVESTSRDVAALTGHMANMMQAMTRLANTGAIHNLQIQDMEARLTRLEPQK